MLKLLILGERAVCMHWRVRQQNIWINLIKCNPAKRDGLKTLPGFPNQNEIFSWWDNVSRIYIYFLSGQENIRLSSASIGHSLILSDVWIHTQKAFSFALLIRMYKVYMTSWQVQFSFESARYPCFCKLLSGFELTELSKNKSALLQNVQILHILPLNWRKYTHSREAISWKRKYHSKVP